jgi:hypothetical protein
MSISSFCFISLSIPFSASPTSQTLLKDDHSRLSVYRVFEFLVRPWHFPEGGRTSNAGVDVLN